MRATTLERAAVRRGWLAMLLASILAVLVACGGGSATAPTISAQPIDTSAMAGDAASLSVTASGTDIAYQWQASTDGGSLWMDIAGATSPSYDTGATTTAMTGHRYRVVVSNSAGSVTSSVALLTVNPAPVAAAFTAQPASLSVTVGSAATFTVAASGMPTPTLQWQRSTDGGVTFANIADATDPNYDTGVTTLAQNGHRYRVVATNSAGTATSSTATLAVNATPQAPAITTQPSAQSVNAPASATFTAAATGVPTPTWQWQVSSDNDVTFANIVGANGASYTTPATTLGDSGKTFRAVASNSSGSVHTHAVRLTVAAPTALAITTPIQLPQGTVNSPYLFTFQASGGKPPYTWFGGPFAGGFSLDPSNGVLSGTATSSSNFSFTVGVRDSSSPPQQFGGLSFQAAFRSVCSVSEVAVANEPAGFNGSICPTAAPSVQVSHGGLRVEFGWTEERDGVKNSVSVVIDNASGQLLSAAAAYDVGTGPRIWQCSMIDFSLPACSGIVLTAQTGSAQFTFAPLTYQGFPHNGVTITLNGLLAFPAYTPPLQPPPSPEAAAPTPAARR